MKPFKKMLGYALAIYMVLSLAGATCQKQESGVTSTPGISASVVVNEVSVPTPNKVEITGTGRMDADVILLSEDPPALAVEIKDASLAEGITGSVSGKGAISSVRTKQVSGMDIPLVRVNVELKRNMTYSLERKNKGVVLKLESMKQDAGGTQTLPYNEARAEVERQISGEPPATIEKSSRAPSAYRSVRPGQRPKAPFLPDMPPPASDGSATVIGDVYFRTLEGKNVQVMIYTNGPANNFCDFNLLSPPRIVVDIRNVAPLTSKKRFTFKWGRTQTVRIGEHMNKTRVVIDINGRLPAYHVHSTYTGIVITLFNYDYYREIKSDEGECLPGYPCDRAYEADLPKFREYVTGERESFRSIAEKEYGNPGKWLTIFTANREIFTREERKAIRESEGTLRLGERIKIKIPVR